MNNLWGWGLGIGGDLPPRRERKADVPHGAALCDAAGTGGDVHRGGGESDQEESRIRAAVWHGRFALHPSVAHRHGSADWRGAREGIHVHDDGDARGRLLQGRSQAGARRDPRRLGPRRAARHGRREGGRQLRRLALRAREGEARRLARGTLP